MDGLGEEGGSGKDLRSVRTKKYKVRSQYKTKILHWPGTNSVHKIFL